MSTTPRTALRTEGLTKKFGGFMANGDISMTLAQGERHALIGPNGAGKTTFVNLLTGIVLPTRGEIFLDEERITAVPAHARVRRGMARTFQINTLFPRLTVLESVVLAICERRGTVRDAWRPVRRHTEEIEEGHGLLERLQLAPFAAVRVGELPYGRQRLVEIALALAAQPKLLLLDEPAAGIPAAESRELFGVLASLPREVTILLIEHDMGLVFQFAERITVLVGGRVLTQGTPAEIAEDVRVREVYLGEAQHE